MPTEKLLPIEWEDLENQEQDPSQWGVLPQASEVDDPSDVAEVAALTPEEVIDDIIADYIWPWGGQWFDVNKVYDKNGNFEKWDNWNDKVRDTSSLSPDIVVILSHLENGIDDNKDLTDDIKSIIDKKDVSITTLKQLQQFLGHPSVQDSFNNSDNSKKVEKVKKQIVDKIDTLQEENKKAEEAKTKAENEKKNQETIDTQDKMVTMLLGLTSMPMTKEWLIKYGEHLDEMKVFLSDKPQFEKVIHGLIDAVEDSKDDKETKNKKIQLYQSLIARFDWLKALVWQIETVIYGQWAEALVASVGERSVEDLVKDAQFVHNLNGVIHMQQGEFNKLVTMFGDTVNKSSVMKLIKAYLVASGEISQVNSQNIADIRCVDGAGSHASKGKIFEPYDAQGKIIEKASVRFGVKKEIVDKTGKSILSYPPAQIAEMFNQNENGIPNTFKKAFTDMLNPSTSDGKDAEGKPRRSFSQLLEDFWNSDTWESVKKLFLSLGALNGKFNPESKVELDYLNTKAAIKKERKDNKQYYIDKFTLDPTIDIVTKLNEYKFAPESIPADVATSTAAYETVNGPKGERAFFNALSLEDQVRYLSSPDERVKIKNGDNTIVYTITSNNGTKVEEKEWWLTYTEFKQIGVKATPSSATNNLQDNGENPNKEWVWTGGDIPELWKVEVRGKDAEYVLIGEGEKQRTIGLIDWVWYTTILDNATNPPKEIIKKIQLTKWDNWLINGMTATNKTEAFSFEEKKEQLNLLKDNGIWSLQSLINQKSNKDFPLVEYFITHACVLDIPHDWVQAITADLQRKVIEISQSSDGFTKKALVEVFSSAKTLLDMTVSKFSESKQPLKKDAEQLVGDWYKTFKLD